MFRNGALTVLLLTLYSVICKIEVLIIVIQNQAQFILT